MIRLAGKLPGLRVRPPAGSRLVLRSVRLVLSASPWMFAAYVVLVAAGNAMPVAGVWLVRRLVDSLTVHASASIPLGVLYALTLLLPAAMRPAQAVLMSSLMDWVVAVVDRALMAAGRSMPDLYRVERPEFADALQLSREAALRAPSLLQGVQWALGETITLGGLLILLGTLNPLLPVALAVLSLPRLMVERRLNRARWQVMVDHSRSAREMDYCVEMTTDPVAAKEVRVFGIGGFFLGRFEEHHGAALAEIRRLRMSQLRLFTVFGGLHAIALAGGLWYVATESGAGRMTLGDVALYLNAVVQAENRLLALTNWLGIIGEILLRLSGTFRLLDDARPRISLPSHEPQPSESGWRAPTVEFRHVRFRYPESTQDVLEDVSFRVEAGEVTAIVGVNGAGKSTIVKLLTRMYDPSSGLVLFDGVPIQEYDLEELRRRISVTYQDFARLALTLGENIAIGRLGAANAAMVQRAARLVGADEVAAGLSQGYDTGLTRRFEGGVDLSGGEWQKVALARAAIREADLVVLDEPTAALDADAEYRLFQRFRELMAGRTTLMISHRFSTARMADQIVVLDEGSIVEAGTHAGLLARGGHYATLYEMQAGRYR